MCTAFEKQKRVKEVVKRLCSGEPQSEILHSISQDWEISDRQAKNYVADARKQLRDLAEADAADERGKAIARMEAIYKDTSGDSPRVAIEAQKEINKLLGLYAPEKQEHTGKDGGAISHQIEYVNDWRAAPSETSPDA